MNMRRLTRLFPWAIGLLYFLLSHSLPFWGDSIASVSKAAVRIFEDGLLRPWNYPDADPGHPTLFPWFIALGWKVFGKFLWVSHAQIALCAVGILHLIRLQLRLYSDQWQLVGQILVTLSPLFVSQSIEISLAMPLTLAFLTASYALKAKKQLLFLVAISALPLLHLQGLLLLAAIGLYDIWRSWPLKLNFWKRLTIYLFPALAFVSWLYFHHQEFGWALITPNYERAAPTARTVVYNLAISSWRLLDLGYLIVTIPVLFQLAKSSIGGRLSDSDKLFIPTFLVLAVGIPMLFAYPPNHRYFFPIYLLMIPLFIRLLQSMKQRRQGLWILGALSLLLSGNIWNYPGKCLGDQNLVFLSYRNIETEMRSVIPEDAVLHSFAPLNNSSKFTSLEENGFPRYTDLYNQDIQSLDWVLESNLNCEYTAEMRAELSEHFVAHCFESGGVYANVWMNKRLLSLYPDFESGPHVPGTVEKAIRRLRDQMKG